MSSTLSKARQPVVAVGIVGGEEVPTAIPSPEEPGSLARAVVVWSIYAIVIVAAVRPIGEPLFDPDIWWHLRNGGPHVLGCWVIDLLRSRNA